MRLARRAVLGGLLASPFVARARAAGGALQLWHDLGDPGTKWFAEAAAAFAAEEAGFELRAISYPTDQWFGRVVGALNTDTAPDLLFNNYERVIRIAKQTGKVADLGETLEAVPGHAEYLGADDLKVARYDGRTIILPVQRVQMAFGVRKSWLDEVGESFPTTWADARRVGQAFQKDNPKRFAFALEAAKPRDLIHILDLFTFGAGLQHTLVDPEGQVVIDEPQHAEVLRELFAVFTTDRLVAPDTINHSFPEMYQMIEGGRAGMFRVGDWNVAKWDGPATLKGDFLVGPWPQHFLDKPGRVVIGGMRGVAVPENSPNRELATRFAAFLLSQPAQQASLKLVGAAVRKDLDTQGLSERQRQFAAPQWPLAAYDFPEATLPWYPELEASFHRRLVAAMASPPDDTAAFVTALAADMRAEAKTLAEAKKG